MPQWSLVKTKEAFVGVGGGDRSTSSPGSFIHHASWKKGVTLVNSQLVASCQSVFLILSLQLCLNYLFLRPWVECLLMGRGGVLLRILGGSVLLPGSPKLSWPYFRPKNIIFHTRFQNWPLGRNYVTIDLSTNKKILRIQFGNVHTLP